MASAWLVSSRPLKKADAFISIAARCQRRSETYTLSASWRSASLSRIRWTMVRVSAESLTVWIPSAQLCHSSGLTRRCCGIARSAAVGRLARSWSKWARSVIGPTISRMMKRSYKASSPWWGSGVSLEAAISAFSGACSMDSPLRKMRSLMSVSSVLRIAGLDFQISSRKANSAFGR